MSFGYYRLWGRGVVDAMQPRLPPEAYYKLSSMTDIELLDLFPRDTFEANVIRLQAWMQKNRHSFTGTLQPKPAPIPPPAKTIPPPPSVNVSPDSIFTRIIRSIRTFFRDLEKSTRPLEDVGTQPSPQSSTTSNS